MTEYLNDGVMHRHEFAVRNTNGQKRIVCVAKNCPRRNFTVADAQEYETVFWDIFNFFVAIDSTIVKAMNKEKPTKVEKALCDFFQTYAGRDRFGGKEEGVDVMIEGFMTVIREDEEDRKRRHA